MIAFWVGAQPLHHTPLPSTPSAHRPLLTEILNTPMIGHETSGQTTGHC